MCHPERGGYHFPGTATGPNLPRFSCAYKKSKPFVINKTLIDARAILSPLCRVSPQPSRYHFSNATVELSSSGSGASLASDGRISCATSAPRISGVSRSARIVLLGLLRRLGKTRDEFDPSN